MATQRAIITPSERNEALDSYAGWLSEAQIEMIRHAPEGKYITLLRHTTKSGGATEVIIGLTREEPDTTD